jgi:hypothetical protein
VDSQSPLAPPPNRWRGLSSSSSSLLLVLDLSSRVSHRAGATEQGPADRVQQLLVSLVSLALRALRVKGTHSVGGIPLCSSIVAAHPQHFLYPASFVLGHLCFRVFIKVLALFLHLRSLSFRESGSFIERLTVYKLAMAT